MIEQRKATLEAEAAAERELFRLPALVKLDRRIEVSSAVFRQAYIGGRLGQ